MIKKVRKNRGKIATIILLFILLIPFFTSLILFRPQGVLGTFEYVNPKNFNFESAFGFGLPSVKPPEITIPNFNKETVNTNPFNRNLSMINLEDLEANAKPLTKPPTLSEAGGRLFELGLLKPFSTKLIIRDQVEDAVANTFFRIKSSYDITYGKNITTIFISKNDPKLPEDKPIAISYKMALRLGIIATKETVIDVIGVLKR